MNKRLTLVALSLLAVSSAGFANPKQLAESKACLACHGIDNKIIGPAYKDVAAKYGNSDTAKTKLLAKVKAGGSGVWGSIPMPPQAHVSDEDLDTIVSWILTLN
ncbi:MAG: c-type cytochrome [Pseudomonadota bacterium]